MKEKTKILSGPIIATLMGSLFFLVGMSPAKTLIISMVIGVLPFGLIRYSKWKRMRGVEENFSNFLRDLGESVSSGIPLYQAVKASAEKDYGKLSPHIHQMTREISLGLSFEEAFKRFGKRTGIPRVERAVMMVLRANSAGGKIDETMKTQATRTLEVVEQKEKRRANMLTYTIIAYASFFAFLAIIISLVEVFFPAMAEASGAAGSIGVFSGFTMKGIMDFFFYLAVVQAGATGILAGKLGEGKIVAGIKHIILLVIVTYVFFHVI